MITTTVALEAGVYRRLKYLAADERSNIRRLIREAVALLLAQRERQ